MGSFGIWHWLIVLLLVVLIFGTKKLHNVGWDLGAALRNFKDAVRFATGKDAAPSSDTPHSQHPSLDDRAATRNSDTHMR
jgi:sec-independent protein translocase protein TatA